jgi:transposase
MLKALEDEKRTPEEIAELAQGSLKKKKTAIAEAVRGQRLSDTQKEMIRSSMRHMTFLELEVEQLDGLVAGLIRESGQQKPHELLQTIPGIQQEAAGNLLAETGSDMKQFADAGHLSSWGGICPGNNESAGKHKSRHTTHGNPWFRVTLTECAWSASRTKGTAFQAKYESLKPKIGHKRALVAVAHLLTHAIYHVLSRGEEYRETKPKELNEIQRQRIIRRHTRRLRRLGAGFQPKNSLPCRNGMSRIASRTSIPLSPSAKVGRKQCYGTVNL